MPTLSPVEVQLTSKNGKAPSNSSNSIPVLRHAHPCRKARTLLPQSLSSAKSEDRSGAEPGSPRTGLRSWGGQSKRPQITNERPGPFWAAPFLRAQESPPPMQFSFTQIDIIKIGNKKGLPRRRSFCFSAIQSSMKNQTLTRNQPQFNHLREAKCKTPQIQISTRKLSRIKHLPENLRLKVLYYQ